MQPLQLNAFQFINEALTRFESEFEGPLARFESEHGGDKVLPAAFRKYVTSQIDGEVRASRRVDGGPTTQNGKKGGTESVPLPRYT